MKDNRTPAWSWRHAILQSDLPPTTRHVLLVISCFMNEVGDGCFRTTREFAEWTGLSERAICTHIQKAVETGWLEKAQHGFRGQKWKTHEYRPLQPEQFYREKGTEPNDNLEKKALNLTTERTEPNDTKALNEVQQDNTISNYNLNTISNAQEREGGADAPEREKTGKEVEREFDLAWHDYDQRLKSSRSKSLEEWIKLSPADREIAARRIPIFKKAWVDQGGTASMRVAFSTYLSDRRFEQVADPRPASDPVDDGKQALTKFGKAWCVVRLAWLRAGPKPVRDRFDLDGKPIKAPDYMRYREMYPKVHAMDNQPVQRLSPENAVKPEILAECVAVAQGSAEWQAWVNFHALMDWPMVEVGDWDSRQWNEFFKRACSEMNADGQKLIWMVLLEYAGGNPPLPKAPQSLGADAIPAGKPKTDSKPKLGWVAAAIAAGGLGVLVDPLDTTCLRISVHHL